MSAWQSWLQVVVLLLGIGGTIVGAIVYQTHYIDKRIDDLRSHVDGRFADLEKRLIEKMDALRSYVDAKFEAVEVHFKALGDGLRGVETRLDRVEARLDKIEDRLEHPVARP